MRSIFGCIFTGWFYVLVYKAIASINSILLMRWHHSVAENTLFHKVTESSVTTEEKLKLYRLYNNHFQAPLLPTISHFNNSSHFSLNIVTNGTVFCWVSKLYLSAAYLTSEVKWSLHCFWIKNLVDKNICVKINHIEICHKWMCSKSQVTKCLHWRRHLKYGSMYTNHDILT